MTSHQLPAISKLSFRTNVAEASLLRYDSPIRRKLLPTAFCLLPEYKK
ncbi:MAG: hypothetical protein ACYTEU_11540 [Planctomycetota bacterium]